MQRLTHKLANSTTAVHLGTFSSSLIGIESLHPVGISNTNPVISLCEMEKDVRVRDKRKYKRTLKNGCVEEEVFVR